MRRRTSSARPPLLEVSDRPVLITGGAGFIGTNVAHRLLSNGQSVLIYDNLSRNGVEDNLRWLKAQHGDLLQVEAADTRDQKAIVRTVRRASRIFHFAAQVAVTTSIDNPITDFEINGRGTLNLLEAIRLADRKIPLVFTSTNKVYGALDDIQLTIDRSRYKPRDQNFRTFGISESRSLQFHSPYGCSKGIADQYVLDYAHTFKIPTTVFRMSCIYGPHQYGTEDQGWVAHFLIQAIKERPIVIYGDGKQVRDILYADDLVDALLLQISGEAFNIGGGPANAISLLELVQSIERLQGKKPHLEFDVWRRADQRYYVSDTSKFQRFTGWNPKVSAQEGIEKLYHWLMEAHGVALPIGQLAV
jgi:CDP-paratose 2-epimerase